MSHLPSIALDTHGPNWRDWVLNNLKRDCNPQDMLALMTKSTWEVDTAVTALEEGLAELDIRKVWKKLRPTLSAQDLITLADGHVVSVLGRFAQPNAALLDGVLTPQECKSLIDYAYSKGLRHSGVVDADSGESVVHQARTSTSVFMSRGETQLIASLERRLADLTGWPLENGEGLQVLRYEHGQQYKPHYDWFDPATPGSATHLKRGGQRVATTVVYLATAEAGGSTSFPKTGVRVSPRAGGAIFFNDVNAIGQPDELSLHGGNPVERGVKIVATYWQREGRFGY